MSAVGFVRMAVIGYENQRETMGMFDRAGWRDIFPWLARRFNDWRWKRHATEPCCPDCGRFELDVEIDGWEIFESCRECGYEVDPGDSLWRTVLLARGYDEVWPRWFEEER